MKETRAMAGVLTSRTIAVSIDVPSGKVYEFASNPENLPRWASGLGASVRYVNGEWWVDTPQGPVRFRFTERNPHGVLDHYVSPEAGLEIYVPMRIVPNGSGSEVLITLFRQPDVSEAKFQEDAKWVQQDLNRLKAILETAP